MAETTADVRRDIEMTRQRMSHTIAELERKLNVMEVVREHPWPAIAVAASAGFLLAGTGADVKAASAAAATGAAATRGAGSRVAPILDELLGRVLGGVQEALEQRADALVGDLRRVIGVPATSAAAGAAGGAPRLATSRGSEHAVPQREAPVTGDRLSSVAVPSVPATSGAAFHGESREQPNAEVVRAVAQRAD